MSMFATNRQIVQRECAYCGKETEHEMKSDLQGFDPDTIKIDCCECGSLYGYFYKKSEDENFIYYEAMPDKDLGADQKLKWMDSY